LQISCRLAESLNFAAIVHRNLPKTADTVEVFLPESIRAVAHEALRDIDQQIANRIDSLDF
jgi:hypothetical protein